MVLVTPASDADEVTPEGTKKKMLQVVEKRDDAGSRLVEYFVVVTSVPKVVETHISAEQQQQQQPWKTDTITPEEEVLEYDYDFVPKITARFPLYDHPDNPLHENVTFFCHPGGAINLRTEPYMPKVHYFVATGGHGKQMYGTCLTLWEPYLLNPTAEQKQVYLPKCVVLLSTYPYLMAFREYLTQLNRLSKMGEMSLPLERYIINFCCEIPAPPPGSFEVQTTILDSVIKIWSPPHNQPIPWVSLPFSHLFECLDLDNVVLVWRCLCLERQVLLTSTQLSVLTTCAEILLSLLYPMRWSHAYISVLPHFLIPILSAPMPFLCGIHKANLAEALYDLSRECVVVDLDKNLVTLGPDTAPLPPLPPQQELKLCDLLEQNVGMVFREARSLTKNDDYSDSGQHLPIHIKLMAEAMWESKLCLFDEAFHLMFTPEEARKNMLNGNDASGLDWSEREGHGTDLAKIRIMTAAEKMTLRQQSQWDAVQEAFLDTYVYLLRNYRKFLVFPSKDNEGSYGGAGFRSKEFLDSQRYDMRAYLEQLIGTQMFDNFITKRLYGSGEADVAFFDFAVDRFLKNQGILADFDMSGRFFGTRDSASSQVTRPSGLQRTKRSSSTSSIMSSGARKDQEPLLQSARVHRRLKTIVPPEPSGEGLPPHPMAMAERTGAEITTVSSNVSNSHYEEDDNASVESSSTQETHSTRSKSQTSSSPKRKSVYQSVKDKAAEILEKQKHRYTYAVFPSTFNEELFGTPRPLPSAVIAEFDRQRKDAAQFRRKKRSLRKNNKETKKHFQRAHSMTEQDTPPSPEVATFTVFFMAFTAMVGKELLEISHNPSMQAEDKMIIANYVPTTVDEESDFEDNETNSTSPTAAGSSAAGTHYDDDDDNFEDAVDEDEKEGVAVMKTARPSMGRMLNDDDDDVPFMPPLRNVAALNGGRRYGNDDGSETKSEENLGYMTPEEGRPRASAKNGKSADSGQPRQRFRGSLSAAQIEEAKAKGRAQLGLAFEMLTMMKKRALKADPELYQCLIDACGRVGDTKRATDLLAKMHEDGIVADGTVYACLVSAFSAESAWKQGNNDDEELPAWANSTSIEMDWNKLQKRSLLARLRGSKSEDEEDKDENEGEGSTYQKLRNLMTRKSVSGSNINGRPPIPKVVEESRMEFFVTEVVERQIELGENLLEIVYPDISVDTDNETCPRCNFLMSDDDVVCGWTPNDSNDYTTSCPNCTQRFVPHFCVQSTSATFMGSRGPASPLMCERLSPWVLQKEIRTVMSDREGIENLLSPEWRGHEYKNAVLWWNLVLSCMRYRLPFSYLLQGSFEQNLIAPMPEDES